MAESEAKWYVVHTYSGYENKVATDLKTTAENRNLQDMIIDVKVPVEIVTETVGDKTKEVENKLFPGYVFVKMVYTDETWYVVRNIRGCTGFVGPGSKPVPLSDYSRTVRQVHCRVAIRQYGNHCHNAVPVSRSSYTIIPDRAAKQMRHAGGHRDREPYLSLIHI